MRTLLQVAESGLPKSGTIPRMQRGLPQRQRIKDVNKVVAVSSAKGGVGKSTIAANLALAFARQGYRSGILDTDLFGPSIPTLFALNEEPRLSATYSYADSLDNQLIPLSNYGVKTMSMGYLIPEDSPVVWRGLMVMKAMQQLLHEVEWGGLDVLVLDLPPGTGDTQLSLTQQIEIDGTIIVTTPHNLAVKDAVKGINMFQKLPKPVPILGLVGNMGIYKCPCCNTESRIFGYEERIVKLAKEYKIDMLAEIPLSPEVSHQDYEGQPTVVAEPDHERAKRYMDLANKVADKLSLKL
ncbi:hypothetical protein MKZ38_001470 [Zalerion maritima]|uniref:Iron-sulfur protein NUBPL n=1 Tax=Zalerion maritima TaxID=339359 RepID=A0AAD5WX08_9PEZI|nr:hypothetical protein MKZ38_001470 [Zalerion maritima]